MAGSQLRRGRAVLTWREWPEEYEVTGYVDAGGVERTRPARMGKLMVRHENTAQGVSAGLSGWQVRVGGARWPYASPGAWLFGSLSEAVKQMQERGLVMPPGGD